MIILAILIIIWVISPLVFIPIVIVSSSKLSKLREEKERLTQKIREYEIYDYERSKEQKLNYYEDKAEENLKEEKEHFTEYDIEKMSVNKEELIKYYEEQKMGINNFICTRTKKIKNIRIKILSISIVVFFMIVLI